MKKLKEEEADGDTSGSITAGLSVENSLGNPGHSATSDIPGDAPAISGDNLEVLTGNITRNVVRSWLCFPLATFC